MSQVQELKQALENISAKQHVISKEARYAKETLSQPKASSGMTQQQSDLMNEFNVSISLLNKIFSESRFDEVMGLVAQPLRLILLNFVMAFFRGVGFVFGGGVVAFLIWSVVRGFI